MSQGRVYEGGCLCGAVWYLAAGELLQVAHCHFKACRRSTGAAFATDVCFSIEAVTWVQDFAKDQVSWIKLDDGLPRHSTFPPIGEPEQGAEPVKVLVTAVHRESPCTVDLPWSSFLK